jgi:hypothetical protein
MTRLAYRVRLLADTSPSLKYLSYKRRKLPHSIVTDKKPTGLYAMLATGPTAFVTLEKLFTS